MAALTFTVCSLIASRFFAGRAYFDFESFFVFWAISLYFLAFIQYVVLSSGLRTLALRKIWKLLGLLIGLVFAAHIMTAYFALPIIYKGGVHLLSFSLSVGYLMVALFLGSCVIGVIGSLFLSTAMRLILSTIHNLSRIWHYVQLSSPEPIYRSGRLPFGPEDSYVIQKFLYYFVEFFIVSFWLIVLYQVEVGKLLDLLLVPVFAFLAPALPEFFVDLYEISTVLALFLLPVLILFPLFLAENSGVVWYGKLLGPKRLHRIWPAVTLLTLLLRLVTGGFPDIVSFIWAIWLMFPVQFGFSLGFLITERTGTDIATKRIAAIAKELTIRAKPV